MLLLEILDIQKIVMKTMIIEMITMKRLHIQWKIVRTNNQLLLTMIIMILPLLMILTSIMQRKRSIPIQWIHNIIPKLI